MKSDNIKYLAHFRKIKDFTAYTIISVALMPLLIFSFGVILNKDNLGLAAMFCLKWSLIIIPIVLAIFLLILFFYSDRIEFTDNSIRYYRHIFTKKYSSLNYDDITEFVISDGRFKLENKIIGGFKIFIYNKNSSPIIYESSVSIIMCLFQHFNEEQIKFVDYEWVIDDTSLKISEKYELETLGEHFDVDYLSLTEEECRILCKYYCKPTKNSSYDGNKILKKYCKK